MSDQGATNGTGGTLRIKLVRSTIGKPKDQEATVRSLGLRKLHQSVELPDTPSVRGMVNKVRHLLNVEGGE
jgi:large subunit ribosomal protein L30